jgi:hypothetical protein
MRWRLILEEFGPELNHIKGKKNIVADALSRLELSDNELSADITMLYGMHEKAIEYPIAFSNIRIAQQADTLPKNEAASNPKYHLKSFHEGGNK